MRDDEAFGIATVAREKLPDSRYRHHGKDVEPANPHPRNDGFGLAIEHDMEKPVILWVAACCHNTLASNIADARHLFNKRMRAARFALCAEHECFAPLHRGTRTCNAGNRADGQPLQREAWQTKGHTRIRHEIRPRDAAGGLAAVEQCNTEGHPERVSSQGPDSAGRIGLRHRWPSK